MGEKKPPASPAMSIKDRVTRLEEQLGSSPDVLGNPGGGVLGKLAGMDTKLDELIEVLTRRRAVTAFVLKIAAVPVVGGLATWALHWLSGLHH